MGRLGLDLGAQALDRDVDQPRIAEVVVAPDLLQEELPREDLARSPGELGQEAELGVAQRDLLVVATNRV